ncbi:MAG: LysR family transcriptional regulator [Cephaloticoccus sp.]|nr:LysR family transcriptional regulator [Cephaloticoccus sp.]MCF7760691.1 LysR family transcriptional regulator [Cephaloticoccus sp.]
MPYKYHFAFELRHLVYFEAVAEHLHFRKAAETLGVAQPALSRQIAQLEAALGVMLFNRTQRKVELTAAGQALQRRLEPILDPLGRLPDELQSVANGGSGHIRIAFTGLAMATVLPGIIREFSRHHPGIQIELNESPTTEQLQALRTGAIDCGFFHPDSDAPQGIQTRMLLRQRNGLLLPVGHSLCLKKNLKLNDVNDAAFVLFPRKFNPGFYDRIIATCTNAGVKLKIAEEVWPRANGIGLVRAGMGVTFITPSEAQNLPPEVVFRPLEGPTPESRLMLGWRKAPDASAAVQAFLNLAKSVT